jgi:hypothetical protein
MATTEKVLSLISLSFVHSFCSYFAVRCLRSTLVVGRTTTKLTTHVQTDCEYVPRSYTAEKYMGDAE